MEERKMEFSKDSALTEVEPVSIIVVRVGSKELKLEAGFSRSDLHSASFTTSTGRKVDVHVSWARTAPPDYAWRARICPDGTDLGFRDAYGATAQAAVSSAWHFILREVERRLFEASNLDREFSGS